MSDDERPAPGPSHIEVTPAAATQPGPGRIGSVLGWLDERTSVARVVRAGMRKVFPDHWSFLLGEVALFCFVILVLTGTFLTLFYVPSASEVTYQGPYAPMAGTQVSAAYDSVLRISFETKAGLLRSEEHTS